MCANNYRNLKNLELKFANSRQIRKHFNSAKKDCKKDHSFYNPVSLKEPHSFYKRQLTQHYKNYTQKYSPNRAKNMFLVSVRKKHLHCTISRHPRIAFSEHMESKCLYIPVNLRSRISVPKT